MGALWVWNWAVDLAVHFAVCWVGPWVCSKADSLVSSWAVQMGDSKAAPKDDLTAATKVSQKAVCWGATTAGNWGVHWAGCSVACSVWTTVGQKAEQKAAMWDATTAAS